ncbi:hypothetical protein E2R58_09135 [Paenibacillus amylolyticus]|uniref:hypothetical protein n=1 Tax=Paenibacillus amylolyticus TaxID=1451 RepID=UPI0010595FC8|nr:hypothetical protein [Paenibacillus amylolyticus]TDL69323.1 hypothetical protein E2R58_09135 [Paenibacillus amylolyticus]
MPKLGDVYERGNFFQQLAGAHQPSVEDVLSDRGYFGLKPNLTAIYGNIRTEDGEIYELLRNFNPDLDTEKDYLGLVIQSTKTDGANLIFDTELTKDCASAKGTVGVQDGNEAVWRKAPGVVGDDFEIRFSEDYFVWKEEKLFSLEGPMIKPGLHWYLPGRDEGTYYVSHLFELTGEFQGVKAKGFVAFDQVYMAEGAVLYGNRDIMMENFGHIVWYTWANKYKDGSVEGGHFLLGHDRLGFAVFTDGKTVTATQNIEGKVATSPDSPFSQGIEFTIEGENWTFTPDPRGKMPAMLQKYPPTPQQEGRMQRVGETREVDSYWAWGETETKHGNTRMSKLPTRR